MRNKYLGIVSILFSFMIGYLYLKKFLGYFLIPSMQVYLLVAGVFLFIIGVFYLFSSSEGLVISDLLLIIPFVFLFFIGDGKLSMNLANNRSSSLQYKVEEPEEVLELNDDTLLEEEYDFTSIDFDVVDETYAALSDAITYSRNLDSLVGKTIRVRGFALKKSNFIPSEYFAIGKYLISCCAADAGFSGFFVNSSKMSSIKEEKWYEIEGVLEMGNDTYGQRVMIINAKNIKEISSRDEIYYIYPCYSYGDGSCKEMMKYNLK